MFSHRTHRLPQKESVAIRAFCGYKTFVIYTMKKILLYLQSIFYTAAGINHFCSPDIYYTLIPPYFPSHPILNIIAGTVEIICGALLLFKITRKWAAYGIVLMLLAFVPAHIYHMQMKGCLPGLCFPEWTVWLRLFLLHPILIAWAWWYRK
jgi:uncharacterized membrane protein